MKLARCVDSDGLGCALGQSLSAVFAETSPAMRQVAFAAVIVVISVTGTLVVVQMIGNKQPRTVAVDPKRDISVPVPAPVKQENSGPSQIAANGPALKDRSVLSEKPSVKSDDNSQIRRIGDDVTAKGQSRIRSRCSSEF